MASTGTSDHGFPVGGKSLGGDLESLAFEFPKMESGTYFLSLSGHRPGDRIALFPSRSLLGKTSDVSMEDILEETPGEAPVNLPPLEEFKKGAGFSSLRPVFAPGFLDLVSVPVFSFFAEQEAIYQIQLQGDEEVWRPYRFAMLGRGAEVTFENDAMENYADVRVQQMGRSEMVSLSPRSVNQQLLYQTIPGVPGSLYWSPNLEAGSWQLYDGDASFPGDGNLRSWFFEMNEGSEKGFFRIEED